MPWNLSHSNVVWAHAPWARPKTHWSHSSSSRAYWHLPASVLCFLKTFKSSEINCFWNRPSFWLSLRSVGRSNREELSTRDDLALRRLHFHIQVHFLSTGKILCLKTESSCFQKFAYFAVGYPRFVTVLNFSSFLFKYKKFLCKI